MAKIAKTADRKKMMDTTKSTDCPQCGQKKLNHHVCPSCGTYNGNQILTIKEKRAQADEMRIKRRQLAQERSVPPYVVFSDATLRARAEVHRIVDGLRRSGGAFRGVRLVGTGAQ